MTRLPSTVLASLIAIACVLGGSPSSSGRAVAATAQEAEPETVDPERFGQRQPDRAFGAFQRGLYITALNLALPRAKEGDPAAQTLVAEIYARGLGIARDEKEAAHWYAEAAGNGVPEAQFQYALMLLDGRFVEADADQAYKLMEKAADAGNPMAQFNYAQMVLERESGVWAQEKAVAYFQLAADSDAQYAMAEIYAQGVGGTAKDEKRARDMLVKAARQNYDTAQLMLGTWLVEGIGGEKNLEAGFQWLQRAAQSGNVAAQNRLAKLYWFGLGTEGDSIRAAAWYIKARRAGLFDRELELLLDGLTPEEQREAIQAANRL